MKFSNKLVACALLLGQQAATALPVITSWPKYAQELVAQLDAAEATAASTGRAADDPSMHWFTSRLDHYDRRTELGTWQQRSFQNDTFFNGTGPVFLCVGGEGPAMDASVLVASVHCNDMVELAPKVGALLLAVEHRYYGLSMPTGAELPPRRLQWLSSQQALGDLAAFHAQVAANYSLTAANKWVTFGGSYPGMMAGFARLKFPHLFHAAVSSSSPWKAQIDMQEYQDLVGDSLAVASVGGSDACQAVVVNGHAAIAQLIVTDAGRQQLAAQFNFCDPATALPTEQAAGAWAGSGVVEVPSQENDPGCTANLCDIGKICAALLGAVASNGGDNVAALAAVSAGQHKGCLGDAAASYPLDRLEARLAEAAAAPLTAAAASVLSWPYQTCTEWGFYQTCEFGSRCPFVQGYNNLSQSLRMCQVLFQKDQAEVQEQIDFSNAYYGADAPKATRILFPNGNVDPWHGLGVLVQPAAEEPVMMVEGASHHAWTHPAADITQDTVAAAKVAIQEQVVAWLAEDD